MHSHVLQFQLTAHYNNGIVFLSVRLLVYSLCHTAAVKNNRYR